MQAIDVYYNPKNHRIIFLLLLLSSCISVSVPRPVFADDEHDEHSDANNPLYYSAQLRQGYIRRHDENDDKTETVSLGGKLSINTKPYRGLSVGATFFSSNPLFGIDEENLFLGSKGKGYTLAGEAYVKTKLGKTEIKLGRQELDTPFADSDDIGMVPNLFEAMTLSNNSLQNTTIIATHLSRWAGIDAPKPEKFSRLNGTAGVNTIGVIYQAPYRETDNWYLQGWHYFSSGSRHAHDTSTGFSYLEAGYKSFEKLQLGLQMSAQNGNEFNGKAWGIQAQYAIGDLNVSAAFNKVSDGRVSNGYGGGPYFTSAEDHTIAEVDGQKATAFGLEYQYQQDGKQLNLSARQVNFNQGANELDLSARYKFNKRLTADLVYSDMHDDGDITRVFINYNF